MKNKRIMIIGPSNCGKTTLVNALNDNEGKVRPTQELTYGKKTIDVPGAYLENGSMHKHIIAIAQDASHIFMLVDQSNCIDIYPPGFATCFTCPVIGIITKSDLCLINEEKCMQQLKDIGISEPYFKISFPLEKGIDDLEKYLMEKDEEESNVR